MGNARSKAAARHLAGGADSVARMYTEPLLGDCEDGGGGKQRHVQADAASVELRAVIHQLNSFYAVLWPVATAMILTSAAVCCLSDPQTARAMSAYMLYKEPAASWDQQALQALCNAALVVLLVALLTFALVLLYKLDGMKLFLGYCVLYSGALLGVVGAKLVVLALGRAVVLDQLALALVMYNFAVVGVLAVFYQQGVPPAVERGYLVATSVIVAWQLAQLPQWSVWMLLLLLACWDLFAVLAPVGPLRLLVDLVQEKGTPIPGLLFQANVPDAHTDKPKGDTPAPTTDAETVKYIQERHAKLSAASEAVFFRRLLAAGTSAAPPSMASEGEQLTRQLRAFLHDQHSQFEHRASALSRAFAGDSPRLWRNLYAFYNVCSVSASRPYPPLRRVFPPELVARLATEPTDADLDADRSIKLGLGDFIFYSVLAARAAAQSFAAFAACFVAVLAGLAATLYLLASVDALPALPISIFAGVAVFLLTTAAAEPLLDHLAAHLVLVL